MFLFILSRNLNQDEDLKTILYGIFIRYLKTILYGIFIRLPLLSSKLRRHSASLSKSKSSTFGLASLTNEPMCQAVYETLSQERW